MARPTALVKISGDLVDRADVIEWLREVAAHNFTVILVGGGVNINQAFKNAGFPTGKHGPLGRETQSLKERQLARDVLEMNQELLQDLLAARGIVATVIIPVLDIGSVLCHINGDVFVLTAYIGFDKIFILTLSERVAEKQKELEKYPKIQVIGFPEE